MFEKFNFAFRLFNKKSIYIFAGIMLAVSGGVYWLAFMSGHKKTEKMSFVTSKTALEQAVFASIVKNRTIDYSRVNSFKTFF